MNIIIKAKKILNDPNLIKHRDMWFTRLQNLFDNRPDDFNKEQVLSISGICGNSSIPIYENPELWVKECLENLAEGANTSLTQNKFTPLCIESDIYGVHFIDSIFGCEIFFQDGQWYNRYLGKEVGSLAKPDINKCEAWQIAKRAAEAFVRQEVSLPLFGLPTIASALNIAVNLYGDEILAAMLAEPENARHDLKIINDTLCELHDWYRSILPSAQLQPVIAYERTQPPGYGQICGCTTQLVSGEVYRDMIAPLDAALLAVYPHGGMIHLCGAHQHIIPVLRDMPNLKAVQINDRTAVDLEKFFTGLRNDQIIYFMPCDEMSIDDAIKITGGDRLVIQKPPVGGSGNRP